MLRDLDIVVFTYADWRASWSTPQQIATRLVPQNRVLYVDVPRPLLYFLKKPDPQGAGAWTGPALQEVLPGFFVYHPPHVFLPLGHVPFGAAKAVLEFNGRLAGQLVRRVMKKLNFRRPLLWNFSPLHGKGGECLVPVLTVFDACDEWTNYLYSDSGRRLVMWIEEYLCRQADVVFAGTENMKAARDAFNPETHVVYHAADYATFSRAALDETPVPADIAALPHPIIGSVGVMDPARFDTELMLHLASTHPDWSIVLVGPARADMDVTPLKSRPNIHLLGNRAIPELPGYLKAFDVAMVPYKVNEATRNIYPLKLQEYLATGKPVVSQALPALLPYADVIEIAESHEEFAAKVRKCLGENSVAARQARQEVARKNSWEQRIEEKSEHIVRVLNRKNRPKGIPVS